MYSSLSDCIGFDLFILLIINLLINLSWLKTLENNVWSYKIAENLAIFFVIQNVYWGDSIIFASIKKGYMTNKVFS